MVWSDWMANVIGSSSRLRSATAENRSSSRLTLYALEKTGFFGWPTTLTVPVR